MAIVPIRLFPDPVLRQVAAPVGDLDDTVRSLVRSLADTMYSCPNGAGLAAPQIGVLRRVFVYDIGDGLRTLIDPVIVSADGRETRDEGCLSIPDLYLPVERADRVTVAARDVDGNTVRYEATLQEARVIQHEHDHLDGVLFIDRLDRDQRRVAMRFLRERDS